MQTQILEKLKKHLLKDSFEESDVVYILSRIRKLIEISKIEGNAEKYNELNFFCNWALHVQIDRFVPLTDLLINIKTGSNSPTEIFPIFVSKLSIFLNDRELKSPILSSRDVQMNFLEKLGKIYEDTPLVVRENGKVIFTFTITQSDIGIDNSFDFPVRSFEGTFRFS